MHNNDDGKGMESMMWVMVICCAAQLLLIFVFGAGGKALGAPSWIIFGGIAVMIIAHLFMMVKSHKHSDGGHEMPGDDKNKDGKNDKTHGGHGCCH